MIVDDHPGFRSLARALLESEGFAVVGEAEVAEFEGEGHEVGDAIVSAVSFVTPSASDV